MKPPFIAVPTNSDVTAHYLACHTLPLGIKEDAQHPPHQVISRATCSLLEIGRKHFFLTCAHVLNKFHEIQEAYPNAQLAAYTAAPHFIELSGFQLIDLESKVLDVAVLRGQEDRIHLPERFFIPFEVSYLVDPTVGEPVCIVGYPGENIEVTKGRAALDYIQIILP